MIIHSKFQLQEWIKMGKSASMERSEYKLIFFLKFCNYSLYDYNIKNFRAEANKVGMAR